MCVPALSSGSGARCLSRALQQPSRSRFFGARLRRATLPRVGFQTPPHTTKKEGAVQRGRVRSQARLSVASALASLARVGARRGFLAAPALELCAALATLTACARADTVATGHHCSAAHYRTNMALSRRTARPAARQRGIGQLPLLLVLLVLVLGVPRAAARSTAWLAASAVRAENSGTPLSPLANTRVCDGAQADSGNLRPGEVSRCCALTPAMAHASAFLYD